MFETREFCNLLRFHRFLFRIVLINDINLFIHLMFLIFVMIEKSSMKPVAQKELYDYIVKDN